MVNKPFQFSNPGTRHPTHVLMARAEDSAQDLPSNLGFLGLYIDKLDMSAHKDDLLFGLYKPIEDPRHIQTHDL